MYGSSGLGDHIHLLKSVLRDATTYHICAAIFDVSSHTSKTWGELVIKQYIKIYISVVVLSSGYLERIILRQETLHRLQVNSVLLWY